MNSPDLWTNAWATAWSHWTLELARQGWHPLAMAAALLVVALVALAAASVHGSTWRRAALVLGVLALNTALGLDQLLVQFARALAQGGGWYGARRDLQTLVLLALALAVLAGLAHRFGPRAARADGTPLALRSWGTAQARPATPDLLLALGMGLVVGVAALRGVSLHSTDQWLALRTGGLSLGRLLEGLGLACVAGRAGWLLHHGAA